MANKLVVVGFDGMTWDAVEEADTPNLDGLIDEGGSGQLTSTNPPVTCPAWPTYLTGKNPYNHTVYDFAYLDDRNNVALNEYGDIQSPTLIDVMDSRDRKSIFFEIPLTYPAPETKQLVISGYPSSRKEEKFSHTQLRRDLEDEFGEFPPIGPVRFNGDNREETIQGLFDVTDYRADAFCKLLRDRDWNFATINFHLSDQTGHFFWDEFEKNPSDNALVQAYEKLDGVLGKIRDQLDSDTNLVVMSDHGHGRQDGVVNLNHFLLQEGYIKLKNTPLPLIKKTLAQLGATPKNIKNLLDTLNLSQFIVSVKRETRDKLLDKFITFSDVDWEKTRAFAFGHIGQIYWTGEDPSELDELKSKLGSLGPDDRSLVDEIINLRQNDEDRHPSKSEPLWLLKMNDWATISYPLFLGRWGLMQEPTDAGCHRPDGILAWAGPDLANRDETIDTDIVDLAPTIHRLLNVPPQADFDGSSISELLGESAPDPKDPVNYGGHDSAGSDGDDEERVEQLKNLGYL